MKKNLSVLLLSEKGILEQDGRLLPHVPFQNVSVIAGACCKANVAVIVNKSEVWIFCEQKWNKVTSSVIKLNCISFVEEDKILVGTENARLAWVKDGMLNFIESFDTLPERSLWNTPWGGPPDVRSLAVSGDGTIYANIHVGWIARSTDSGKSWKALKNAIDMDVRQVGVHQSNPDIVYVATANGFYISYNHGQTFFHRWNSNSMPHSYQRSCACFADQDVYLVSSSLGPHGQADALLFRSEDDGKNWNCVSGLPENIPDNIDTFHINVVDRRKAFVIVNNTSLYETDNWGKDWSIAGDNYPRLFGILII